MLCKVSVRTEGFQDTVCETVSRPSWDYPIPFRGLDLASAWALEGYGDRERFTDRVRGDRDWAGALTPEDGERERERRRVPL